MSSSSSSRASSASASDVDESVVPVDKRTALQQPQPALDRRFYSKDISAAMKLHEQQRSRIDDGEPFFLRCAQVVRAADAANPDPLPSAKAPGAGERAMSDLKKLLAGLRSSNRDPALPQPMPPCSETTDARLRAHFVFDSVDGAPTPASDAGAAAAASAASSSAASSASTGDAKSSIQLDVRPLHRGAFEALRRSLLDPLRIPVKLDESDETSAADVVGELRMRLKPDANPAAVERLLEAIRLALPRTKNWSTAAEHRDFGCPRVEDGHLVFVGVLRDADDLDPLEKMMRSLLRSVMDTTRADKAAEAEYSDAAPLAVRHFAAKLTTGQSLARWIAGGFENTPFALLRDGATLTAELVLRDAVLRKLVDRKLADAIFQLDSFSADDARSLLGSAIGGGLLREATVSAKLAPPELLFGMGVREGGHALRRTHEGLDGNTNVASADEALCFAEKLAATGCEDLIASNVATALWCSLNAPFIRGALLRLCAIALCVGEETRDAVAAEEYSSDTAAFFTGHIFEGVQKCCDAVVSARVLLRTMDIRFAFENIVGADLLDAVNPGRTRQTIVDLAKAQAILHHGSPERFADDFSILTAEQLEFSNSVWDSVLDDRIRAARDELWRGARENQARCPDEIGPVIQRMTGKKNSMLRVVILADAQDETEQWATVCRAFGINVVGSRVELAQRRLAARKEKRGGGDKASSDDGSNSSSSADSSDDEAAHLPEPGEGAVRAAFVQRKDGRYVHFIRTIENRSNGKLSASFLTTADAIICVNKLDDKSLDMRGFATGSGSRNYRSCRGADAYAKVGFQMLVNAPVLHVSTKLRPEAANRKSLGSLATHAGVVPRAERYVSLHGVADGAAAAALADSWMDWLIANAAHPERGTKDAVPAAAFDWPVVDPIMIP